MSKKKCVAVIFGGQSSEHEVSRTSAQSVISNIDKDKFNVVMIGITKEGRWLPYRGAVDKLASGEWQAVAEAAVDKNRIHNLNQIYSPVSGVSMDKNSIRRFLNTFTDGTQEIDIVFPILHGCNGEDGTIQGLFELADIPYVGCGVLASAAGMDKGFAKVIFEKEGIRQADYLVLNRSQIEQNMQKLIQEVESAFSYPCFVKPCNAGSSVGVSKAGDRRQLQEALELAARYDRRILVEEYIDGREVECAVLGNENAQASCVGEIIPCNEFYDYKAKYSEESTSKIKIPAEIPKEICEEIRECAVRAFKALDCSGLSRVDFFIHKKTGRVYLNEINTLPGFTNISMYPKLWNNCGISYSELIERLIQLAFERYEENKKSIVNC